MRDANSVIMHTITLDLVNAQLDAIMQACP